MATLARRSSGPAVLRHLPYDVYEQIRDEPANHHLRMTYYDGTLEILSPEFRHEADTRRLGLVVLAVARASTQPHPPCTGRGRFDDLPEAVAEPGPASAPSARKEPDDALYLAGQ